MENMREMFMREFNVALPVTYQKTWKKYGGLEGALENDFMLGKYSFVDDEGRKAILIKKKYHSVVIYQMLPGETFRYLTDEYHRDYYGEFLFRERVINSEMRLILCNQKIDWEILDGVARHPITDYARACNWEYECLMDSWILDD